MQQVYGRFFTEEMKAQPYTDDGELMGELYLALNGLLAMAMEAVKESGGSLAELPGRRPEMEEMTAAIRREMERIRLHIEERMRRTDARVRLFFMEFADRLGLSGWQRLALLLGSACDRDARYGDVFAGLWADPRRRYATRGLVYALAGLAGDNGEELYEEMLGSREFLRLCFRDSGFVLCEGLPEEPLVLARRLFYLFHGHRGGTRPEGAVEYYDPTGRRPVCFQERRYRELRRLLRAGEEGPDVILLQGRAGSGRKFLVKQISEEGGRPVVFGAWNWLRQEMDVRAAYDLLYLELLAENGCLCITDCCRAVKEEKRTGDGEEILSGLVSYMKRRGKKVIVTTQERLSGIFLPEIRSAEIRFGEMDSKERSRVWRHCLGGSAPGLDTEMLGGRYVLNTGEIEQAVNSAVFYRLREERGELCEQDVLRALRQYHAHRLSGHAQLLESPVCLEDLVTGRETGELLRALLERMRYRNLAGEEWGFYGRVAYGRGICALFYGPPGTGKTMAAQALANELGLDLYRVDLSCMMSKYIGETEKNISRLFERAANINALLFFDEADAFFSRRTQVNDSHDRNANGEVAHLLQKLEEYEGLSVLATNRKDNIDDAFSRRIQYMIPFPFPDAAGRCRLWRKMLPAEAPAEEKLELDWFAGHFEMAGAEIREALMQAAVQAAAEGCGLRNSHIAKAVRRCMAKYGKEITDEEMGCFL